MLLSPSGKWDNYFAKIVRLQCLQCAPKVGKNGNVFSRWAFREELGQVNFIFSIETFSDHFYFPGFFFGSTKWHSSSFCKFKWTIKSLFMSIYTQIWRGNVNLAFPELSLSRAHLVTILLVRRANYSTVYALQKSYYTILFYLLWMMWKGIRIQKCSFQNFGNFYKLYIKVLSIVFGANV
jgi:hypothetical protein